MSGSGGAGPTGEAASAKPQATAAAAAAPAAAAPAATAAVAGAPAAATAAAVAAPAAAAAPAKENEPTEEESAKELDAAEADLRAGNLIADRRYLLSSYPKSFVAKDAITRWIGSKIVADRAGGVALGQRLYDDARIHHVSQEHKFKDADLYYRFLKDEKNAPAGPSLAKLTATEDNVCHSVVWMSGTWRYSKCYAVLSREQKTLFLYENELSASPKRRLDLSKCKYSVSECGACKTGFYCLKLNGCEGVNVLCVQTSQEMDKWTHGLVQAGVASLEDENDEKALKSAQMPKNFFEFKAVDLDGKEVSFSRYKGHKLAILAFPCNQFGSQEPGTADDIRKFVGKYGVAFDVFAKIKVNGGETHPVFRYLKANTSSTFGSFIKWNFTKFLVNRSGIPTERFAPSSHPSTMLPNIEKLLKDVIPADAAPTVSVDVAPIGLGPNPNWKTKTVTPPASCGASGGTDAKAATADQKDATATAAAGTATAAAPASGGSKS